VTLPSLDEVEARLEYAAHRADPPPPAEPTPEPEPAPDAEPDAAPDAEPAEEVVDDAEPPDEAAAVVPDAPANDGEDAEKELSSGFILGIALVVVVLIFGLFMARMHGRINGLEAQVLKLQGGTCNVAP